MAKAQAQEELVERIVVGPKGIHCRDPETGKRVFAKVGDTVHLPARTATAFATYLEAPEVAAAKKKVAEASASASDKSLEELSVKELRKIAEPLGAEGKLKADLIASIEEKREEEDDSDES